MQDRRSADVRTFLDEHRFSGFQGVGELSRRRFTFTEIFSVVAVPGQAAAAARVVMPWADPQPGRHAAANDGAPPPRIQR